MRKTYKRWVEEGCPKVYCECPCHGEITIKESHKKNGIPKYIKGHYIHTDAFKLKQSNRMLGVNNHFYNKHHTEESRQKIKDNLPDISGENNPMYGRQHTEVSKEKNRRSHLGKRVGSKSPRFGVPPSPKTSHGKRCHYNSPLQGKICFRSSYELAYAKYLDKNNILWYYEYKTFDLGDITYTPDFFLVKENKFIEVKGYMSTYAQNKIDKFLEQYPYNFEILRKKDLLKLGIKL